MSSDNYYFVRPATRRERGRAGLSGKAWAAEMRFASSDYVPGERGFAEFVATDLDEVRDYAFSEYTEYGVEDEGYVSGWLRLIAPVRVRIRNLQFDRWYRKNGYPSRRSAWRVVKDRWDRRRQAREWRKVVEAITRFQDQIRLFNTTTSLIAEQVTEFMEKWNDWAAMEKYTPTEKEASDE